MEEVDAGDEGEGAEDAVDSYVVEVVEEGHGESNTMVSYYSMK